MQINLKYSKKITLKETINEELPADTHVITVHAVISAFNQKEIENTVITYEIEPHVALKDSPATIQNPYYRINSTSGEIFTTNVKLDFEEVDTFKMQLMRDLKVKASSADGLHRYLTHVSLEIVDQNDNSPKFEHQSGLNSGFYFCVVENTTNLVNGEHASVGMVSAEDLDSGLNGEIEYKLNETALNFKEVSRVFRVDSKTGQIFLK